MSFGSFMHEGLEKGIKSGVQILESNKAINPIKTTGKFILGETDTGIRGTLKAMSNEKSFGNAIKSAYTKGGLGEDINWKAVAGTYVGGAAVGRVASGGGLYRDANGNVNLPIVPFI